MTSFRQFEANRRNAQKSTGPKTEEGKRQSRRNAIRHGLCAETVIEPVEDVDDYRGFEATITADFDAETAVERELVLRLASLLWRIRRATSIETDLIRFQTEVVRKRRRYDRTERPPPVHYHLPNGGCWADMNSGARSNYDEEARFVGNSEDDRNCRSVPDPAPSHDLAHSFQRLNNLDNGAFERVGRYETALWRQVVQLMFVLQPRRRRKKGDIGPPF
jgi:hypothetical protein